MELYKVDQSRATVVLCSFYGATSQVRQKYGEIWVGKGFSVITMSRGSPDPRTGYITPESDAEQAVKAKSVLDTMIANGLGEQKVIFHVMSEGGISSWLQLSHLISTNSDYLGFKDQIVGYVLDSCPYHFGYISSYHAVFSVMPPFQRYPKFFLFTISVLIKRLLSLLPFATRFWPSLSFSTYRAYRETLYTRYMGSLAQLYIWSNRDTICSPDYISNFVARRQLALPPGTIDTFNVQDTAHVQILRGHREEYIEKIDSFIARLPLSSTSPLSKL